MMRAPDIKAPFDELLHFGTLSTAQWQVIKRDLDAVGIDLDAKLPSMPNKPWWLLSGLSTLRDAIQHIARSYGLLMHLNWKPPTPLQHHATQRDRRAIALALCAITVCCRGIPAAR